MRLIYPIVILFLLSSIGFAQLEPDKERFEVVLHPGEVEERTLTVINTGDSSIHKITSTQVIGNAKDFIFLEMPEEKPLKPQDKAEIKIYFALPPETAPGSYTGYIYLLESTPPSLPVRIEFDLQIIRQESYGLSMTIDDAASATLHANAEDIAQFDLAVKNLGIFRDVAIINSSSMPQGWSVTLLDGEKTSSMPYDVPLDPGSTHIIKLQIKTSEPGKTGDMMITAASLGNQSKNASVHAKVEFGVAVRGYSVDINVPVQMAANKSYKGTFEIALDVNEKVLVGIVTPSELMVIPLAQVVEVAPGAPGIANFTMLASHAGNFPIVFKLMDSHGISMPEETASVNVVAPEGTAVLTGEDFLHSTVASLCIPDNKTLDVITVPYGKLSEKDREKLQDYARILILGNRSIVSKDAETDLSGIEIKRLQAENLNEECWLFAAEMWQNGTSAAVLSDLEPASIFRAYQLAKINGLPLVVSVGNVTERAKSIIKEMTRRNTPLSKALAVGEIGNESSKALQDAGVSIEEVTV
jgi:hypothetical protein